MALSDGLCAVHAFHLLVVCPGSFIRHTYFALGGPPCAAFAAPLAVEDCGFPAGDCWRHVLAPHSGAVCALCACSIVIFALGGPPCATFAAHMAVEDCVFLLAIAGAY